MKTTQIALLEIIPAALFLLSCGDDVTQVTKIEETSGLEMVASADSLGKCTAEISGEMKFATKENAVYICADSAWKNVSETEKTACSAEALSDSSGFKIVCDGDSIGVVKNGANGIDGKDGENCELSDNGDGTVSVVCGDASTTLYKAFCGGKVYNPDSSFCFADSIVPLCGGESYDLDERFCAADSIVPLCGGKTYDLDSSFCLDGKVYKNKTLVWNLMNPDIEYGVFVDKRDDQVYRSVKIGEQIWMAENLNYAYNQKTSSLDSSSFCYDNEPDSCAKYGRLYLWSAAMDSVAKFSEAGKGCGYREICASASVTTVRGVCPEGWHLPSAAEFEVLVNAVGGESVAGKALSSISGWEEDCGNGTDSFGFSALPAGFRNYDGVFGYVGGTTAFWSSFDGKSINAAAMFPNVNGEDAPLLPGDKNSGYSVRCVRD